MKKTRKSEESANAPTPRIFQKLEQNENEFYVQEREYTKELQREVNLIYLTNELNHDAVKMLRRELEKEREMREVMRVEQEERLREYEQRILEVEQKLRAVEKENELLVADTRQRENVNGRGENGRGGAGTQQRENTTRTTTTTVEKECAHEEDDERMEEGGNDEEHDDDKLPGSNKDEEGESPSLVFRLVGFGIYTSHSILFALPGVTFFWNLTLGP